MGKTITDAFEPYIGTREYNGIVKTIQIYMYGTVLHCSWCANAVSYFANEVGVLDQLGGKNENVYYMMKAARKTGMGTFYYKAEIPKDYIIRRGTVLFFLNSEAPMTSTSSKHVSTAYQDTKYTGKGYIRSLGGNQSDSIKVSSYYQKRLYAIFVPNYGGHSTLRRGDKCAEVTELQKDLNILGYKDASGRALAEDGSYGPKTEAAVSSFQIDKGLTADGICGPKTWAAIDETLATGRTVTVLTDLYVRYGPGTDYDTKGIVREGEQHLATNESKGWLYLPDADGWVSGTYVK